MQVLTNVKIDFASSARSVDNNGFMHVKGVPMFRSGIIEITGMELQAWVPEKLDYSRKYRLRIEQEVLECCKESFAHKPITWGHKWIGENNKNDFIGFTGDAPYIDGDLVCDNMTVADTDAVYRISSKEREELSAGISGEIQPSAVSYADYDLLSFECNHVAVVNKGKAGHRVRILNEVLDVDGKEGEQEMSEEKKEEVKAEEPKQEEPKEDVKEEPKEEPKEEKVEIENVTPAEEKKEETKEEPKIEELNKEEKKDDKINDIDNAKQTSEPIQEKGEEAKEEPKEEGSKEEPKEEPKEELKEEIGKSAWVENITGVEDITPNDPDVSGTTVVLNFEEGGVYEYKDGKIARIMLEEVIEQHVDKKAKDMCEALSICKQIDSSVSLDKDTDSMYRSTAKLVFGDIADDHSGESLKHMLQGYLMGMSANVSTKCEEEKDIRTIEI